MRYLTWRLNWDDPNYGTGPEAEIAALGGRAEASGFVDAGADILGYLVEPCDLDGLEPWQLVELTSAQALAFADALVPGCSFTDDGYIVPPIEE